jgi:hypothetical protein
MKFTADSAFRPLLIVVTPANRVGAATVAMTIAKAPLMIASIPPFSRQAQVDVLYKITQAVPRISQMLGK